MIKSKYLPVLFLVFISLGCKEEDLGLNVIPEYNFDLWGKQMIFYPDGYDSLSFVEYSFTSGEFLVGNNSDNVQYYGMTWEITNAGETSVEINVYYENGGQEIYKLFDKEAPSDYTEDYYYEYTGITSYGSTVSYDGSWNFPDLTLGEGQSLLIFDIEDPQWENYRLTINNEVKTLINNAPEYYLEKYSEGSELDITVELFTDSGQSSTYNFNTIMDDYGWFLAYVNGVIYYPNGTKVE